MFDFNTFQQSLVDIQIALIQHTICNSHEANLKTFTNNAALRVILN